MERATFDLLVARCLLLGSDSHPWPAEPDDLADWLEREFAAVFRDRAEAALVAAAWVDERVLSLAPDAITRAWRNNPFQLRRFNRNDAGDSVGAYLRNTNNSDYFPRDLTDEHRDLIYVLLVCHAAGLHGGLSGEEMEEPAVQRRLAKLHEMLGQTGAPLR